MWKQICEINTLNDAFERILENGGCMGADGMSLKEMDRQRFEILEALSESLESGNYEPFPLLQFQIPKKSGRGHRKLSIPAVKDRTVQSSVYLTTREMFESEFEPVSHGYRKQRGVHTALEEIRQWREKGYEFLVDADIDSFFDNVDHTLLIQKICDLIHDSRIVDLIEKWVRCEVYDGKKIFTLKKGIPQGSVISPMLANLFLDELDETLIACGKKVVRYADDFVILSKTQEEAEENIILTDDLLEQMKLDLNPSKTQIVSFKGGFKFLGAIFLNNDIWLPLPEKKERHSSPIFPPPLTRERYMELKKSNGD